METSPCHLTTLGETMSKPVDLLKALAAAAALTTVAPAAFAQATTVTVHPNGAYTSITNGGATPCNSAPCYTIAPTDRVTGSFTLSSPPAANLNNFPILASNVTSFSFTGGGETHSSTDPNTRLNNLRLTTDATGRITAVNVNSYRWNQLPHSLSDTPSGRVEFIQFTMNNQSIVRNGYCNSTTTSFAGVPDTCPFVLYGSDGVYAGSSATNSISISYASPPVSIPTMSEWAMILFGTILAGGAVIYMHRRRFVV